MQPSDKRKIYISRIIRITVFILLFAIMNEFISTRLEPPMHKSHTMWEKYFAKDNVDTIFVGTSVAEMIDAGIMDNLTGRTTVNMSTPSQFFGTSIGALVVATKQNPVKRVVLLLGFDSLEQDEDLTSTMSLFDALYYGAPKKYLLPHRFISNIKFSAEPRNIDSTDSINRWFSWPVNCTRYFDQIKVNDEAVKYSPIVNLYMTSNPPDIGHLPFKRHGINRCNELNPMNAEVHKFAKSISSIDISEDSLDLLEQMCRYCSDNDIQFIVAVAPHRTDYSDKFGEEYGELDSFLQKFVTDRGCLYVNLDTNEYVRSLLTDDYFTDTEHVTDAGIQVASGLMADYLNAIGE